MIGKLFYSIMDKCRGVKRVRTPTRIQMEAAECGATSLLIILAYYKKYVPPAEMRYRCGVSRDGSDAYNLIKAAEHYGLKAAGYYASSQQLRTEMSYPAILYWEYNHFVVLEGFYKEWVYLNDPNVGPVTLHYTEFEKRYSGVVLTMELSDHFQKDGTPPKFFRPLLSRAKNLKAPIAAILILEFILVAVGIAFALFTQFFIDEILMPSPATGIELFLGAFLTVLLISITANFLQSYLLNRLAIKITISLSTSFFWHVLRLPLPYFHQRYIGEILRRMNLNVEVAMVAVNQLAGTIVNGSVLAIYLFLIFQYDRLIGFATICIIALDILLLAIINERRKQVYARSQQIISRYSGISIDAIDNIESTQLAGSEDFIFQRVIGSNSSIINTYQTIGKTDALLSSSAALLQTAASIFLIGFGGWRVMYGTLTPGMYVTLQILISMVFSPVNSLLSMGMRLPLLKANLERIDDVLMNDIDPLIKIKESQKNPQVQKNIEGDIKINTVTFGYQPLDLPLIHNVSLEIRSGEMAGITGPNGSGKSTLMRLAAGEYAPWSGEVLYDGVNIHKEPLIIANRCLALIEKEALFVPGTIRDNLTLWNPYVDEEAIIQACKDACIHEVIIAKNDGYNHRILENAADFSQGQKQRLDIARALLFNPPILILDEALNGLEDPLQTKIIASMKRRVKTLIVISHRKHVLQLCDRIFLFEKGQLSKTGKYEELFP